MYRNPYIIVSFRFVKQYLPQDGRGYSEFYCLFYAHIIDPALSLTSLQATNTLYANTLANVFNANGECFGGFTYLQLRDVYERCVQACRNTLTQVQIQILSNDMTQHNNHLPASYQVRFFNVLKNHSATSTHDFAGLEHLWWFVRNRCVTPPCVYAQVSSSANSCSKFEHFIEYRICKDLNL